MKIENARYEILTPLNESEFLEKIEAVARTCYKSEDKVCEGSAKRLVSSLIKRGHLAMVEHAPSITVKFIVDRGVSHEIVRHRIASFAQESTRYCNYSGDKFGKEITVIEPYFFRERGKFNGAGFPYQETEYFSWSEACRMAEKFYFELLERGAKPEEARSVLPNSLKTEINMTANVREWRNFFKLRADKAAHPQMREVAVPLLKEFSEKASDFVFRHLGGYVMRIRLSCMKDAAVKALKTGNTVAYDRKDAKRDSLIRGLFHLVESGKVDTAVHYRKHGMIVLTRSSRTEGIQVTFFSKFHEEYIPETHHTSKDAKDLIHVGLESGWYELLSF